MLIDTSLRGLYSLVMDRRHAVKYKMADRRPDGFVPGTSAERIALVWVLTLEATSLSKRYDAKQRLQRDVTSVARREG